MKIYVYIVVIIAFTLFPKEAYMSQVHFNEINHKIKDSAKYSTVIVVAEDLKKQSVYREKIFPKETHYKKEEESRYVDHVSHYKINEVLKGDSSIAVGKEIKVLISNAYPEDLVELYHTTGTTKSPIVTKKKPIYSPQNNQVILFLSSHKDIWQPTMDAPPEGMKAMAILKGELHAMTNEVVWYLEDRSAFHQDGIALVVAKDGSVFRHRIKRGDKPNTLIEEFCKGQLTEIELNEIIKLTKETGWKKIVFKGTLIPDQTKPYLYIGLDEKSIWMVEPSQDKEIEKVYSKIKGKLHSACEDDIMSVIRKPEEVEYDHWPSNIKSIHQ